MITTEFDQFVDYIFLEKRNKASLGTSILLVQSVFQRIMLCMNEHNIHDTVVSILKKDIK